MKKIKWENIITLILVVLYLYDFITVKVNVYQDSIGFGIINYVMLFVMILVVRYFVKELRKGKAIKEITELFKEN